MEKVVTSTGFECNIDPDALNDMELFDCIMKLQNGDMMQLSAIFGKLLSEEDYNRLKDHCRTESGRVPIEKMAEELNNIFTGMSGIGKKS